VHPDLAGGRNRNYNFSISLANLLDGEKGDRGQKESGKAQIISRKKTQGSGLFKVCTIVERVFK
jgi:hypothetical protein